ncbi:hypothetical protein DFP73DRAFT_600767 [Morchella snyderi]|nr:hypothetical protein DFP73DRAFT_600767 [Morchella snyderi]
MPLNKRSAASVLLSAKRPRLPVPPKEHDDSQTDGSEISFRALTTLSTGTRSSQSISTRSSQSTAAPIARRGLLCSTDTSTGRSSPRRVEFHLPNGNTDSAEVQEEQPEEHVPEVEETADTSHSEYDDSPENHQQSSEENPDVPEDEPQASTQQRWQSTGKRPRTVQPATARALGNARRRPTGAIAEVIASSDVDRMLTIERGTRPDSKVIRREGPGRAAPTSAPRQNAFQRTPTASQRASTAAPSQEASQRAFSASQRAFPESQRALPIPSQSMPSSVPAYSRDIDYSSSTRHRNLSSMRSRYGDSSPTYHPYRSSPPFEGIGESSMSSPRIPSSHQIYLPEAQPRVYDIAQLSSSIREEENAPIAESERSLLPSSRSAKVLSMQAQRIEKECSTLIGDHTLLHEPFPPAAKLSVLVINMWAAANRRVGCAVDLDEVVIKQAAQVEYLLKNDRFLSPAQHYESQNESVVKTFKRMSNTWKGRSRQNQEATLEVIKDNLREKIREKKGITIEVIPEDGFSEDDEALAADLAAFRNARKALPSAREDISGSDNGGGQDEVVHAQLRGIEAEEEGEENEEEQEEGITKEARRKRMCREPASALESSGQCFGDTYTYYIRLAISRRL